MSKITIVDPPSGWLYGFPCELPEGKLYVDLLREHKYPEKDLQLALSYSRYWEEEKETPGAWYEQVRV